MLDSAVAVLVPGVDVAEAADGILVAVSESVVDVVGAALLLLLDVARVAPRPVDLQFASVLHEVDVLVGPVGGRLEALRS